MILYGFTCNNSKSCFILEISKKNMYRQSSQPFCNDLLFTCFNLYYQQRMLTSKLFTLYLFGTLP